MPNFIACDRTKYALEGSRSRLSCLYINFLTAATSWPLMLINNFLRRHQLVSNIFLKSSILASTTPLPTPENSHPNYGVPHNE